MSKWIEYPTYLNCQVQVASGYASLPLGREEIALKSKDVVDAILKVNDIQVRKPDEEKEPKK